MQELDENLALQERLRKIHSLATRPSLSRFDHIAALREIAALAAPRIREIPVGAGIVCEVRS